MMSANSLAINSSLWALLILLIIPTMLNESRGGLGVDACGFPTLISSSSSCCCGGGGGGGGGGCGGCGGACIPICSSGGYGGGCGRRKRSVTEPQQEAAALVSCPQDQWKPIIKKNIIPSEPSASQSAIHKALRRQYQLHFPGAKFLVSCLPGHTITTNHHRHHNDMSGAKREMEKGNPSPPSTTSTTTSTTIATTPATLDDGSSREQLASTAVPSLASMGSFGRLRKNNSSFVSSGQGYCSLEANGVWCLVATLLA